MLTSFALFGTLCAFFSLYVFLYQSALNGMLQEDATSSPKVEPIQAKPTYSGSLSAFLGMFFLSYLQRLDPHDW